MSSKLNPPGPKTEPSPPKRELPNPQFFWEKVIEISNPRKAANVACTLLNKALHEEQFDWIKAVLEHKAALGVPPAVLLAITMTTTAAEDRFPCRARLLRHIRDGLGPTVDEVTKKCLASLLGRAELVEGKCKGAT